MKIELLQPITHDGTQYSRGLGDFPDETGKMFLTLKDANTGAPIARVPEKLEGPPPVTAKDEIPAKKKPAPPAEAAPAPADDKAAEIARTSTAVLK